MGVINLIEDRNTNNIRQYVGELTCRYMLGSEPWEKGMFWHMESLLTSHRMYSLFMAFLLSRCGLTHLHTTKNLRVNFS